VSDDFRAPIPILETSRLRLRPLVASDAPDIFAYASDPEVTRYVFWPRHETVDASAHFIAWLNGPRFHCHAIVLEATGCVIGTVFLHSHEAHHRRAELAFNLSRSHWRRGYATEATGAFVAHALSSGGPGLQRLEATCMMENIASARVLTKLGFTLEGTLRQSHQRAGQFFDMKLFARLAADLPPTVKT
jgi:ribosomal-protein-alanine N-acetyltransferase